MEEELAALAAVQGGAFTRAQALRAGLTAGQIRHRLTHQWVALLHGVYVERSLLEDADPQRQHVLLTAARLLSCGLRPVASHRTAALVHALPLLGRPPRVPQLTRPPRHARDRSSSSTLQVAPLPDEDVVEVGGLRVTSLARTACDVARSRTFREAVVVADAALRRGLGQDELSAAAQRCSSWPGGRQALAVTAFADGRADGPLESITRVAYRNQGLPAPETQVEVWSPTGDFLGLVDFLWREQRVIGEADGLGKYSEPLALKKEKLREEGLRDCGHEVVRHVWDDVWTASAQTRVAARVRRAFKVAATQPPVEGVRYRVPSLAELLTPPWQRPY